MKISFCRRQCIADSIEGEFIKKNMQTAALLDKMMERIIATFFPISLLLSTKDI